MRKLLPLGALLALTVAGCSSDSVTGPTDTPEPSFACSGNSGNCGGGQQGGGQHNNNPNNPPATTP